MFHIVDVKPFCDINSIKPCFDVVPVDPYVPENFRYKSIARFVKEEGLVLKTPHGPLHQSSQVRYLRTEWFS